MEYDPASPTDEPEDIYPPMDLSSIPLPGSMEKLVEGNTMYLNDIPLPPGTKPATSSIPLPPVKIKEDENSRDLKLVSQAPATTIKDESADSGPLKFSLKVSKQLTGQENPNEASGVFESMHDLKSDEPRAMPKLQAMMKRSKPCQLPVGVLPSKSKLPATEVKTELFLPTKENESVNQTVGGPTSSIPGVANVQSTDPSESLTNAIKEINALNNLAQMASASIDKSSISVSASSASINGATASVPLTSSGLQIPNLMSLNVQPVLPVALVNSVTLLDSVPVVKPPKVPPTSMQFVNPQKFRSAQMIATPLIANPAVAAQSQQNDDQPKSKDRRRGRSRSRSRSRRRSRGHRRSRSRHRSDSRRRSRHRRSSSSRSSSRHRSTRRRSRSRRTSKDRHRGARDRQKVQDRDRHSAERSKNDVSDSKKTKNLKNDCLDNDRKVSDRVISSREESRSKEKTVLSTNNVVKNSAVGKSDTSAKGDESIDNQLTKNSSKSDQKSRTYRSNKQEKTNDHRSDRSSLATRKSKSPTEISKKGSHEHVHTPTKAPSPMKGTLADLIKKDCVTKEKHSYRRSAVRSSNSDSDSSGTNDKHRSRPTKKLKRKESSSSSSDSDSSGDRDVSKHRSICKKTADSRRIKDEGSPRKRHQSSHTSKNMTLGKA